MIKDIYFLSHEDDRPWSYRSNPGWLGSDGVAEGWGATTAEALENLKKEAAGLGVDEILAWWEYKGALYVYAPTAEQLREQAEEKDCDEKHKEEA